MTPHRPPRPNLLLITLDALRHDALGYAGLARAHTPRIDRLAASGTVFSRAYCTHPHCMPSRASLLTGRFPQAHGVWNNGVDLPARESGLVEVLRQAGYQTACIGKHHFRAHRRGFGASAADVPENGEGRFPYCGFETSEIADHTPSGGYLAWVRERFPECLDRVLDPALERPAGHVLAWTSDVPAEATRTDWILERSLHALDTLDATRPFLHWVSFLDPHHPYNPPRRFAELHDAANAAAPVCPHSDLAHLPAHYRHWRDDVLSKRFGLGDEPRRRWREIIRAYRGKVSHVDDRIGRLLDACARRGLLENTCIVLTSDHGTPLCDFGLAQVGPYSFESNIRVPLVWVNPAPATAALPARCDALVSLVDILPAFFELAGLPLPAGVQGRSLLPWTVGRSGLRRDGLLVAQRWGRQPGGFRTLVTERWKLSVYADPSEGELYDLQDDPREERNLYSDPRFAGQRGRLAERLACELLATEDPLPLRLGEW